MERRPNELSWRTDNGEEKEMGRSRLEDNLLDGNADESPASASCDETRQL